MRRLTKTLTVTAIGLSMLTPVAAMAQQSPHEHDGGQKAPVSSTTPPMPTQGDYAHMAQHMEMCRQMMGQAGMMGRGMMGMPMMTGGDPKQQAEMLAMRGEMMKAMGDIMTKYARRAQSTK